MGLTIRATGLPYDKTYDCGYITLKVFRAKLAHAYNREFGDLYERWIDGEIDDNDWARMNELENSDLSLLLMHCDCDGRLSPKECRRVYNVIKDIKMDMMGHNYENMIQYNMLDQWKGIMKHCAVRRVICWFT